MFETYRLVIIANVVVGVIAMLLFELCPQVIVRLFGNESALYNEYAILCFRIYLSGILLCCIQKASSIFLQSIGKPIQSTLLSLSRDVILLVPGIIIFASIYGVTGMLWAAPIADVLAIALTILFISLEYKAINQKEENKNG